MPRVSIVIPNYNHARFLDERITSLLNQTFRDLELIFVDDGSTDNSREVVEKYLGDPRLHCLWFQPNSGTIFRRWNDGLERATGEYVLFANSDDSCEPTQIETLVRILDKHPNVSVACSQSWEIDQHGKRVKIKLSKPRWSQDFIVSGLEEAPHYLVEPTIQNTSAALARRSLVQECGGLDLSVGTCADWMMFGRLLALGDLAFVAEPLNLYRKHDRTVRATKRIGNDLLEQYHVVEFMLCAFPVSNQVREDSLDRQVNVWINNFLRDGWKQNLKLHGRVYRKARAVDSNLHNRLLRILSQRMRRRFRKRLGLQPA